MLAETYIGIVAENIGSLIDRNDEIRRAAEMIGRCALEGNKVFVADSHGIIDNETSNRASGLALFRSMSFGRITLTAGDTVIIASITPEDEKSLALSRKVKEAGAKVITISPSGQLSESADIALINDSDIANGVVEVPGIGSPFCPISGIINAALIWAVEAETAAYIMSQDKTPTVYWGDYIKGGRDKNAEARKRFTSLGY